MRVFITGVSGFLGAALGAHLAESGHIVGGSATRILPAPKGVRELRIMRFGEPLTAELFAGYEAVVHAAYSLLPADEQRNVDGTLSAFRAAGEAGAVRQVFVSSYSAHAGATSAYGRSKQRIEEALAGSATIVRPGLVIGRGGLFARMRRIVERMPVVPCISGTGGFPVVAIADVCLACERLVSATEPSVANLYLEQRVSLRDLLQEVARALRVRRVFLPIPYAAAFAAAWAFEKVPLQLGVTLENVRGLRANRDASFRSDLRTYVESPRSLRQMVEEAVAAG